MRVIETEVYQYAELDDAAKERARDWYRQSSNDDNFWSESTIEEVPRLLALCGFSIDTRRGKRTEHVIYWSGFWSQGDGACFEGCWAPYLLDVTALKSECPATYKDADGIEQVCKGNAELHAIVDESARLAALDPDGLISWRCSHRGHGVHEQSVSFEYYDERASEAHGGNYCDCDTYPTCGMRPNDIEDEHKQNARDAMRWIYKQLEREYEYQNSDEAVAETIEANGYEFTKDGERA